MRKIIDFISFKIISPFNWGRIKFLITGREFNLTAEDRDDARTLVELKNYIWVSRRRTHLTSYLISLGDWLLSFRSWAKSGFKGKRPRWGYWTHAFLSSRKDEMMIEAVAKGVQRVRFDDVFDCDSVACLVPKFIPSDEWNKVSDLVVRFAQEQEGKPYDSMFDILDSSKLSCIELVRVALQQLGNYEILFEDFERVVQLYKNVTPQMLYESQSFVVVWEVRR